MRRMKTFRDHVIDLRDWVEREAKIADNKAHNMSSSISDNDRTLAWGMAAAMYNISQKLNKILGDV